MRSTAAKMQKNLVYERLELPLLRHADELLGEDAPNTIELRHSLAAEFETMYMVSNSAGQCVGLVQIVPRKQTSFITVFVAPPHRRQGIGSAILHYAQARVMEFGTVQIMTDFISGSESATGFARHHGYNRSFSSAFMKHDKGKFILESMPARAYIDADYDQAHKLYAEAFHDMRMRVGDFPDSKVEQPSEKSRKAWCDDAENRYTYESCGQIVGHGHLEGNEIGSVSIRIDQQGKGIGRNFVKYLCNELYGKGHSEITLWCVTGNNARYLYDSLGFEAVFVSEFAKKLC